MSELNPNVIEATRENFEREVIARSHERPVVVDFWASWCQPCQVLGPILERLTQEFTGKFVLVKVDTEALPEFAQAFSVRSIPAVFGLRGGKVADAFVGALPESEIRAWVRGLLPSPKEELLAEAKALEPTDPAEAESRYRAALELDPTDPAAKAGFARALLHQGKAQEARVLLAALEARGYLEPEAESVKAALQLHDQAESSGGVDACRASLAANPTDPASRLALAKALAASGPGGYEEALALALGLVEEHRKELGEDARHVMVNVFQLLPLDSDVAFEYRRKLSAALY